jgi:CBS domain-containing protein
MKSKINPSPALVVTADAQLSDCIQKMNQNHVGSILVVADGDSSDLIGIFTERDLLTRFDRVVDGQLWNQGIGEVMTSPVKTLDVSELDQVADFMLAHHFRHVPVTLKDEGSGSKILSGMISMRDVFRALVSGQSGEAPWWVKDAQADSGTGKAERKVNVFSRELNFSLFLSKVFNDFALGKVTRIDFSDRQTLRADLMIIDLDGLAASVWKQYLMRLNHDSEVDAVIVVFDPLLHTPEIADALEKIGQADKFSIFKKPIGLHQFFNLVNSVGRSSSK